MVDFKDTGSFLPVNFKTKFFMVNFFMTTGNS